MIRIALVADDDAVARRLVREELEGIGFSVIEARDGEEAWARFRREDPDLVTTDLRMPGLDGIELLRKIRNEAGSWVPVIVMTSHHDPKIFESVFAAGSGGATRFLHLRHGLDQLAELAEELLFEKVESVRERQRVLKLRDLAEQLHDCGGNISEMARRMGVDRRTIYYHLEKAGLYTPGAANKFRANR